MKIQIPFEYESLFNKTNPEQEGIDDQKSIEKYQEMVSKKIKQEYLNVCVEVEFIDGGKLTFVLGTEGTKEEEKFLEENAHDIEERVEEITQEVYEKMEWVVTL